MITEVLAQIHGPNFTAGIVLFDDAVVETAPIVRYMRRWSRDKVRTECKQRGWTISVVHMMEREDVTAPPMPKPGIVQHDESFEAVGADGAVEFFYFDENAGRRLITGRLSREAAFAAARAFVQRMAK